MWLTGFVSGQSGEGSLKNSFYIAVEEMGPASRANESQLLGWCSHFRSEDQRSSSSYSQGWSLSEALEKMDKKRSIEP